MVTSASFCGSETAGEEVGRCGAGDGACGWGERQKCNDQVYIIGKKDEASVSVLTEATGEGGREGDGVLNRALNWLRFFMVAFLVLGNVADWIFSLIMDDAKIKLWWINEIESKI